MEFRLLVRGDRACFTRPEFAEDLISYDVITPLAARCILEAIHAAPALRWRIDELRVLRPIRSTWMSLIEMELGQTGSGDGRARRDQRMALVLTDVAYVVTAHPEPLHDVDSYEEAIATFCERLTDANPTRPLRLGHRSFPASVTLLAAEDPLLVSALAGSGPIDLGWMINDYQRDGAGPRFFRPTMIDGVIDLRADNELIFAR